MGKSRKSTIRKFEFYETITDNGIESGYVRLANTQFHSDAVINQRAALSGLLKQEFCIQSLMHQKVVCYGNIRLISEVKSQLCNIENHLIRLESADNFDADKLEQLRMILELLNSLKENN